MPIFWESGNCEEFVDFHNNFEPYGTRYTSVIVFKVKWNYSNSSLFFATLGKPYSAGRSGDFFQRSNGPKKKPTGIDLVCSLFQRIPLRTPKYLQLLNTHPLFTTRNVLSLTAKTERCLLWTWAGTICAADSSQLHFNPWPCLYSAEVGSLGGRWNLDGSPLIWVDESWIL